MTAHAMKGDRNRCLAAGMDGYLDKPIDAAKLRAIIERLASLEKGAGESCAKQLAETLPKSKPQVPPSAKVSDYVFDLRRRWPAASITKCSIKCGTIFSPNRRKCWNKFAGALARGAGEEIATRLMHCAEPWSILVRIPPWKSSNAWNEWAATATWPQPPKRLNGLQTKSIC